MKNSRREKLIKELCPDGVEYRRLGEAVNILDNLRKPISKSKREKGTIPYYGANGIQDYVKDYIFDGTFLLVGEDGSVVNSDGSPVLNWATGKIWVNNHAHVLSEKKDLALLRFVYFYLQCIDVTDIVRGMPPKINQQNLRNIRIPLPPLDIQKEIVKILNEFTELEAELKAELESRKKQYEYYRNSLLTFGDKIERLALVDVCESISAGGDLPSRYIRGVLPAEDCIYPIYSNGSEDKALYGFTDSYKVDRDAVTISARGTIGYHAVRKARFTPIVRLITLIPDANFLTPEFLNQVLYTTEIGHTGGSIPQLTVPNVSKIKIPIPPLSEQKRIVSILDKFDSLVNDISIGLPAELNARRKQYEYYRNKLLTFKEYGK